MASYKLLLLFALFTICAALDTAEEPKRSIPKNVIIGYRVPNDRLIEHEEIRQPYQFLWYVTYEKTFVGDNHSIITQIRLFDLNTNGNGAIAKVIAGGPGDMFVTLSFESLFGRGIDFGVEIYGKDPAGEQ